MSNESFEYMVRARRVIIDQELDDVSSRIWASEVKELRDIIGLFTDIFRDAPRIGSEKDEPEGSRYIQISETLLNELLKKSEGQEVEG